MPLELSRDMYSAGSLPTEGISFKVVEVFRIFRGKKWLETPKSAMMLWIIHIAACGNTSFGVATFS